MHFLILNGTDLMLFACENIEEARQKAINICDHSKEILVREIETFADITSGITLD